MFEQVEAEVAGFWERFFNSRYIGLLEGELVRLRSENRALTNSLLGTAGFPPVDFPEAPKPQLLPRLRKRSWHQLQAWRETGAKRGSAALTFEENTSVRSNGPVSHS